MAGISRERAERIARAHACVRCGEYSYKRLTITRASAAHQQALREVWHARQTCGICGTEQELGIDAGGEIVYAG